MKSIVSMQVMQGRVFAPDVVPYRLIITPLGTNLLKQALGFSSATWNQESWDYVFQDGTLESAQGRTIPITWVAFNDRRIVIQVLGDSDAAHAAYSTLSEELSALAPSFRGSTPLVFNEETSCVARLDFEWTALLSPALVDQMSARVREFSTEGIRRIVKGLNLRFTLGAVAADESLREYGITPSDQTVILEPRVDVPLSEQTYFTSSPCDSETHLKLVSELEASLSKVKKQTHSEPATRKKNVKHSPKIARARRVRSEQ